MAETDQSSDALEAYKLLLDFQKWTYNTYQRDSQFFLTIEVLTFGVTARAIVNRDSMAVPGTTMASMAIVFGLFLTWVWASRQRREFYLSKSRLERLKNLEQELPPQFNYFSDTYQAARLHLAEPPRTRLPIIFESIRLLPGGYRHTSFLKSLIVQQVIFVAWITLGAILFLLTY